MMGKELKDKLVSAGLTKEHFSKLTNTPIATIHNWLTRRKGTESKCPDWVEPYLDLYLENHANKIVIKRLLEELKDGETNDIQ